MQILALIWNGKLISATRVLLKHYSLRAHPIKGDEVSILASSLFIFHSLLHFICT